MYLVVERNSSLDKKSKRLHYFPIHSQSLLKSQRKTHNIGRSLGTDRSRKCETGDWRFNHIFSICTRINNGIEKADCEKNTLKLQDT